MWKVRSSLAWRIARDFSKRSVQTLRSCASYGASNLSTFRQKQLNFTSRTEWHKMAT